MLAVVLGRPGVAMNESPLFVFVLCVYVCVIVCVCPFVCVFVCVYLCFCVCSRVCEHPNDSVPIICVVGPIADAPHGRGAPYDVIWFCGQAVTRQSLSRRSYYSAIIVILICCYSAVIILL